jgi:hypothetical protein
VCVFVCVCVHIVSDAAEYGGQAYAPQCALNLLIDT